MPALVIASVAAPWGPIRLAATERGLAALDQLVTDDEFRGRLGRRFPGARILTIDAAEGTEAGAQAERAQKAVAAFVAGDVGALDPLRLDLADRPAWDRRVLDAVRGIPRGETVSYGTVARMIGSPGAARAVGGAVGRNPVGLVIPCHRVIAGDGTLGGYGGGAWGGREAALALKRELLAREGVEIPGPAAR